MDKPIVTHRLSLNMDSLAVQATITLAQFDTATHRLIVDLRHGSEIVELPPGSYAIAVQNTEAGVDVLDSVTVYGEDGIYPNNIVYDVTTAVTEKEGYHEACFMISFVNEHGEVCSLASPRIAFVVKPDMLRSSEIEKSDPYAAVAKAKHDAEKARDEAILAKNDTAAIGVISKISLTESGGLLFVFEDGREISTESVRGPAGTRGNIIHMVNDAIRIGVLEPVENPGSYMTPPQTGDVAITTSFDVYSLFVEHVDGVDIISAAIIGNIKGKSGADGISPEVKVSDTLDGYKVTIKDKEGTKSFQLLHGKDGEGGGVDPRKNTLLCDAELGMMMIGEGNFGVYSTMPLADTILPNTEYIVNGSAYTSDADGRIMCDLTTSKGDIATVVISGSTVELTNGGALAPDYDYYKHNSVRVTVIGPGAMTCLAQLTVFQGPNGSPNESESYEVTAEVASVAPYRILYVICDGVTRPVMLDGGGELEGYTFSTSNGDLTLSIKGGKLTLDCISYAYYVPNAKLTVLADTLDIGAGDSSGSSGGGKETYFVGNGYTLYIPIPVAGTCAVQLCMTDGKVIKTLVFENGYVVHDKGEASSYGVSAYTEAGYLHVNADGNAVYVTVEALDKFKEISCFIEGTPVLLRDPSTMELYEKPIEQVLPFEYAAFWNPAKGRLDATRVLAPPIAGDAEAFDRLYFDNGTELDVYGVQFFWSVDTDTLVDWAKMEPGTRVCTAEGDIVSFMRAEHIVPEAPVKHYTLLTYRGRYIAGGIVAGDKRDLIYPRLMVPERVRYWRMLNEADQNGLIKAHREGCRRRNWRYSRELNAALDPLKRRRFELENRIGERKLYLADTDHRVIKFTEGVISEEAFAPDREARAKARLTINEAEAEIVSVEEQIAAETERVRAEIAATWQPKYAGRFVGKNKVILEDE